MNTNREDTMSHHVTFPRRAIRTRTSHRHLDAAMGRMLAR